MSSRRASRSWLIVLILLAFFTVVSSVAFVVGIPTEPVPASTLGEDVEVEREPPARRVPTPPPAPGPTVRPAVPEPVVPPVVPDQISKARMRANEMVAIATSRNVSSAQAQFQATARVDEDGDGTGEFGVFAEMSGGLPTRGSDGPMNPPVLSRAFRTLDRLGRVTRSGYNYAIYLPGPGGRAEAELSAGGLQSGLVDPDLAETAWCMYAWPVKYGETGKRTFFLNQRGDVLSTDCPDYTGENGPAADAAFKPDPATTSTILGQAAICATGNDGKTWRHVN